MFLIEDKLFVSIFLLWWEIIAEQKLRYAGIKIGKSRDPDSSKMVIKICWLPVDMQVSAITATAVMTNINDRSR